MRLQFQEVYTHRFYDSTVMGKKQTEDTKKGGEDE
jgi:hypothetical protein